LRAQAETTLADYMDSLLTEYDAVIDEMLQHEGQNLLASMKPSTLAIALLELASQRRHSLLNIRMASRLSGTNRKRISVARVRIRHFYEDCGMGGVVLTSKTSAHLCVLHELSREEAIPP